MTVSAIASQIYQAAKSAAKGVWNWRIEWSKAMKQAWIKVMLGKKSFVSDTGRVLIDHFGSAGGVYPAAQPKKNKKAAGKIKANVHGVNGWCDFCQSHCFGDCRAN